MKSAKRGTFTSPVEIANVSPHGFWLFLGTHEVFVAFDAFPWFRDASIRELTTVERPSAHHLHWPALDVDLAVESLEHPERYPLVSRVKPDTRGRRVSTPSSNGASTSRRPRASASTNR